MKRPTGPLRAVFPTVVLALASTGTAAQDIFIEEIIVTAQKREQNMQDVPVAVSAYSGDLIQESGIKDIRELANIAPSLRSSQSQTSTTSSFGIRGIGTSAQNFGLESSVGIYIDGVYRSRQSSIINNLVDVEAVEVLRGPQGTLFGKNTPSGALLIRTVKPGHDYNAFAEITAGEFGLLNIAAATNLSLSQDVLALRATIFSGQRDGYVSDINLGSDKINDRDRLGGRLQLYWTPNDTFDMRIIADYSEIDESCCATVTRINNFVGAAGAGTDAFIAAPSPVGLGLPVITGDRFDDNVVTLNQLPRSTNEDSGLSVEFNWDFANTTLTSISAYRAFDTSDFIDADFGVAEMVWDTNIAEQQSFSQEFRLSGKIGETGNYVAGLYYFTQDLDNVSTLDLGVHADPVLSQDPRLAAVISGVNGLSAASGGLYPMAAAAFPNGSFASDDMRQEHESYAVFGQVDFPLGESFLVTAGLRYTDESKDMNGMFTNSPLGPPPDLSVMPPGAILTTLTRIGIWQLDPTNPAGLDPTNPANAPGILAALGPTYVPGWGLYTQPSLAPQGPVVASINDDRVTGTLKLSWFATNNAMFYASYGTGFKSGGTNTDRIDPFFSQTFTAETSEAFEVGLKADFPDQNIRLNVAAHNTQVDDLQTNAFSGNSFILQNAGNADTYGGEVEFWWAPVESFRTMLSYALSIADFRDFPNGVCWVATPWQTGVPDPGQATPTAQVCDRSGDRVESNPEHSVYLAAIKDWRLGSSTLFSLKGEYSYLSDTMTDGNNDPLKLRDSFGFLHLRAGLFFENINAEVAVWGRNLTDERFYETVFDVPVQDGKLNAYPHEPRTWGVSFRKDFD